MSAIGSEMYHGMNARSHEEQQIAELAMWALCGDAPEHIVPEEYAHFKNTALKFVAAYLTDAGVAESLVDAGIAHAWSRYEAA